MSRVRNLVDYQSQISDLDGDSTRDLNINGTITATAVDSPNVPDVNLSIAPEVLEIQVDAPDMGQDIMWKWTWEQSTLPYARRTITNSAELNVPLYKEGTYVVNNFAAYDIHGSMTQTHSLYLKWVNSAGTDNLVSWATSAGPISDTHPSINGGNATDVQRITVNVPATITPPSLTNPSVAYTVTNTASGSYTFSGSAAGNNPNIGPFYRGGTYTINISATGHPFYFTTDNGTNFSAGTYFGEYTSGVTGSRTDSGTITFTVPAGAPDTLYYQCGNHSAMRGEITVKDLAVETNINGNYVVYFQHTQEGHATPVELRPIPSLVNQMCIVYDAGSGKFVPQDLATYVENTPSFENKIREVAGTAELVVEDGSAVIAKVNVYDDSTYLPLTGNNPGDQAFATDTDILYIWDGSAWQQAGAANSDDLTEGTTNLFYTDARVGTYLSSNDFDTATNIIATITDSAPATLDTLNELAAALGDDPNFATTTANNIALKAPINNPSFTGNVTVGSGATARGSYSDILIAPGGDNGQIEFWGANTSFAISHFDNDRLGIYSNVSGSWDENRGINITSDGKVGIGTTAPDQLLEVRGNGKKSRFTRSGSAGTLVEYYYGSSPAGGIQVQSTGLGIGGAARENDLFIKTDGKVGIGTSSPSRTLTLVDATNDGSGGLLIQNYLPAIELDDASGGGTSTIIKHDGTNTIIENGGSESMRIDTNGNIGIGGATSPVAPLDIFPGSANGTMYDALVLRGGANSTQGSGVRLHMTGTGNDPLARGVILQSEMTNNGNNHDFSVWTSQASSHTKKFTIDNQGQVAIGTDAPSGTRLHIKVPNSGSGLTDAVKIQDSSGYVDIAMYAGAADGEIRLGSAGQLRGKISGAGVGSRTDHNFDLYQNSTTAARLMSSINGTGRRGLHMLGNSLAFDESSVRSWEMRAEGGNLRIDAGDGYGKVQVSSGFKAKSIQLGNDSANSTFGAQTGYIGDWWEAGHKVVYYLGYLGSSASSPGTANWFNFYTSGHWGQYTRVMVYHFNHYPSPGYSKWDISGTTVTQIEGRGSQGSVTSSQSTASSNGHSGQPVYKYTVNFTMPSTYTQGPWFVALLGGGGAGHLSNAHSDAQADTWFSTRGGGMHLRNITTDAMKTSPMYVTGT